MAHYGQALGATAVAFAYDPRTATRKNSFERRN